MYKYNLLPELKQSKKYQKFPSQPGDCTCKFYFQKSFLRGIIVIEKKLNNFPSQGTAHVYSISSIEKNYKIPQLARARHM